MVQSDAFYAQDLGDFIGAGVLPYTVSGGRVKLFLGKELSKGWTLRGKHKYFWSDFGGKKEDCSETAEATASREFSEETLGLWGGMGPLRCEDVTYHIPLACLFLCISRSA